MIDPHLLTVHSRGVYSPDGSDNLALVPFLDMFNHSPEVSVKAETLPDGSYNIVNLNKVWSPSPFKTPVFKIGSNRVQMLKNNLTSYSL